MKIHVLILPTILACAIPAVAQEQPEEDYRISADVDRVILPVTVTDHKGETVSGLTENDFKVLDDGHERPIRSFSHLDIPLAVGIVVDNSASMTPKREATILAALHFIRLSNPEDQMFVVNFNEHVNLGLPPETPFTGDPQKLLDALNGAAPAGKTALYDAIALALSHLSESKLDKKALLVITDGGDNASHHSFDDVLAMAQKSNVLIYTIGELDERDPDRNTGVLKKLAHATGGQVFLPDRLSLIGGICQHIARDLRTQYTIGFAPAESSQKGAYHRVQVVVNAPGRGRLSVRTRPGYYTPSESMARTEGAKP